MSITTEELDFLQFGRTLHHRPMSHTNERIEMVQLLQKLKRGDEKPGSTILRSLRLAVAINDKDLVIAVANAIKTKYPNDLAFANAGFTLGVAACVADALKSALDS